MAAEISQFKNAQATSKQRNSKKSRARASRLEITTNGVHSLADVSRVLSISFALLLLACEPLRGASQQVSFRIAGKEYIRLADWAKANGFDLRWIKRDESLQLGSQSSKIVITVDSREAQVNGIHAWLSFPAVNQSGAVCLAKLDAQTLLEPLLSLPKNRTGAKIRTVSLDPGHGGHDPGNHIGSKEEKTYTLLLAQEVRQQLIRAGLKATLTRNTDAFIELPDRPDLARRQKADLFVSLHFNSADTARNEVHGSEVYCLTPPGASSTNARGEGSGAGSFTGNQFNSKNVFLGYQIQRSLTQSLGVADRGVRRARFAVLRDAAMPAVLIEAGFMSHPVEGRKIFTATYRQQMARAIVDGILAYKRTVERG
jgi:N-acetylmuramoyl-L-alanine amidase